MKTISQSESRITHKHAFEEEFRLLLQSKGWKIIRSGWPDYAGIGPNGDKVFFELKDTVKGSQAGVNQIHMNDKISPRQRQMHEFLESCGIPVYIVGSEGFRSESDLYRLFNPRRRFKVSVPFRVLQALQKHALILQDISRKLSTSPQLVAYHLNLLVKWGLLKKNEKNGTYGIADEYSKERIELQPFFNELRSQCKDDEEAIKLLINHLLIATSKVRKL